MSKEPPSARLPETPADGQANGQATRPVVLNVGGSILMPEEPKVEFLVAVAACLTELTGKLGRIYVVVGGGRTARRYITLAREAGKPAGRQTSRAGERADEAMAGGEAGGTMADCEANKAMAGGKNGKGGRAGPNMRTGNKQAREQADAEAGGRAGGQAGKTPESSGGQAGGKGGRAGKALTEAQLDDLGIDATRLNARLLLAAMQTRGAKVPWKVPVDIQGAVTLGERHDCVVMGGTVPGHTTDAVAAPLAERVNACRLVIATNVDGVYTADPKKDPGAERVERLDFARLVEIVGEPTGQAGVAAVVDPTAARIAAGIAASIEGFELAVVNGTVLADLAAACLGESFEGSLVRD